jgi:hypothetical protein
MATITPRKGAHGKKRRQWRVTVKGFPPQHGTCPTKECARECARPAEEELRVGRAPSKQTLGELIDLYEVAVLPTIPDSAHLYHQHLTWWKQKLGALAIWAITPQLVAECKVELAGEITVRGRLRSPATVNRYLNSLSAVFTWAGGPEVRAIQVHPVRDVERLKEAKGRVRFLSRPVDEKSSELERLLTACGQARSDILLDLMTILLSTGCRVSEVLHGDGAVELQPHARGGGRRKDGCGVGRASPHRQSRAGDRHADLDFELDRPAPQNRVEPARRPRVDARRLRQRAAAARGPMTIVRVIRRVELVRE